MSGSVFVFSESEKGGLVPTKLSWTRSLIYGFPVEKLLMCQQCEDTYVFRVTKIAFSPFQSVSCRPADQEPSGPNYATTQGYKSL